MTTVHKRLPASIWLAVLVASALATAVAAIVGVKDVAGALAAIGWRGLGALVLATPVPMVLLGAAWFLLAPRGEGARLDVFVWGRLVRDAAGELLPFSPLGGFFIGARASILRGLTPRTAFSTSIVDVTTEMLAQLGFTALGLGMLVSRLGAGSVRSGLVEGVVAGLGLSALAAVLFIVLQRRGGHLVERIAERVIPGAAAAAGDLRTAISAVYGRPARVVLAASTHFAAWTASGLGVWLALRAAGVDIKPAPVLAIESLVAAARSAVVVAPMGLGVQEATYALVAPLFGLGPETALALSIIKRARDLIVGAPALMSWQAMEGMRVMGRRWAPPPATPLVREAPASAKG
ncbi:MAG: flippase-like domain-containing protein [Caulobacteraceae bacterium]|nr:flippase-like domain-containing protein [Caulobacteraceae bacterium]